MRPEHLFVLGIFFVAFSLPLFVGAFSTSNRTMRGPVSCMVLGGILILWANLLGPAEGFSVNDVPRLALDMIGAG